MPIFYGDPPNAQVTLPGSTLLVNEGRPDGHHDCPSTRLVRFRGHGGSASSAHRLICDHTPDPDQ